MPEQPLDLTISLRDEVDDEELAHLTRHLRDEIAELGVEAVGLAPGTTLPPGAKGDPITIGSIVVTLATAGVFSGLIELLKSWALRREGRKVNFKAKVHDQEVELSYSPEGTSPKEMSRFVSAIVATLQKDEKKL